MTAPIKVTILGPTGRLGRALCNGVLDSRDFTLVGAIVRSESSAVGQDIGDMLDRAPVGCVASVSFEDAAEESDIILDASLPAMTVTAAERLAVMPPKCGLITGVTGFSPAQLQRIEAAATRIPLLMAGNFSLGVAVTEALVAQAARMTSDAWDIEISETHHRNKTDAPSGTALMLGRAAARERGVSLDAVAVAGRDGMTGKRPAGAIGFASSRGGAVVGEHAVRFLGEMDEISISHRAYDRAVFARGALAAAHWMCNGGKSRPAGPYSMQDVVRG